MASKRFGSIAVALAALSGPAAGAQDFSAVEVKATRVAGSVWMLEGAGGNIGVSAGPDGVLIVDDQFAPLADKIRKALAGIAPAAPAFVLNTHWHGDHTGANAAFGREATIIAHDNVRRRLAAGSQVPGRETPPAPKEALPVITFGDSLTIHFNGEPIEVIHAPKGHTDGDSIIWFRGSNVVHMGDHFFSGRFPFVDLASGGDVEGYIRNVEAALGKLPPAARIIPGHGPLSGAEELRTFLRMLKETSATVKAGIAAGRSRDDLVKAGLGAEWKGWAWAFIDEKTWIGILHESLSRPPSAAK